MDSSSFSMKIIGVFTALTGLKAYALILGVLFACGIGVPIPEDITLISAGILASKGSISFIGANIAGFVGVLVGDMLLFFIGKKFGRRVFTWPIFRKIFTEERIQKAEVKILKHARKVCFTARFMPGLRAPIYLTAGIMKVPTKTFIFQDGFAALISVPVWVYVGYIFGNNIEEALEYAHNINVVIITILMIFLVIFLYRKFVLNKGAGES